VVKISGGRSRGLVLAAGRDEKIRPTTGRVKEALFSMIAASVSQARVLDLFAGSGSLGLEALSRGAASAFFVENNRQALALIRDNIKRCGYGDQATVLTGSAVQEKTYADLNRQLHRENRINHGFDLVFLDPPYGQGLAETALNQLATASILLPGAVIVTEEAESVIVSAPTGWSLLQSRGYGDTRITIWVSRDIP
jgi:16S rRNA (guanine966-N2)-methyltransferase